MALVPPDVNDADGIHGPVSLPAESDFDDELSELGDGGIGPEKSGGMMMFRGGRCADTGVGRLKIISAAIKPDSA